MIMILSSKIEFLIQTTTKKSFFLNSFFFGSKNVDLEKSSKGFKNFCSSYTQIAMSHLAIVNQMEFIQSNRTKF